MSATFDRLDPAMRQWIWRQGWDSLKPVQEEAIAPILARDTDVIISAATAAGKTEAAFLPIITDLLQNVGGEGVGFSVLYLSPLKALINDQTRRLEEMTADTSIAVHPWHGDVAASRKLSAKNHPSGILLVTPESLESMLARRPEWAREAFSRLRYVVVDELHSFMGSERGKQLQSLLERLATLTGNDPPRIGLSATIAAIDDAAKFLRPSGGWACKPVVSAESSGARISLKEYIATAQSDPKEEITSDLMARLRGTNNLVFTNSRKDAEAYMVSLSQASEAEHVPCEFTLHHGSLSTSDRRAVEEELQSGSRPVTAICTASMELGVDIGAVNSVAQIGTAVSPSVLRQRLGRSGRRGNPATLRLYSVDEQRDDYKFHLRSNLVQNIAVVDLMSRGQYDEAPHPDAFLSIAVQQLVSLVSQYGSFYAHEAYDLLSVRGAFPMLSRSDFAQLLRWLGEKKVIGQLATGQLVISTEGERQLNGRDFYSAFTSAPDYTVIDRSTQRTVGAVQYKPYYGEIFILAGQKWIVDAVEERSSTVYVSGTAATGKMMFEGTGMPIPAAVTRHMRTIYGSSTQYPWLDAATGAPQQLAMAREWFSRHSLDETPWLAHAGGVSYLSWSGMDANRAIALMSSSWLGINPTYDHLALSGLNEANVADLHRLALERPDAQALGVELAAGVPRVKKERGKFDAFLPEALLNRQYAAQRLNVSAAIDALGALNKT